MPARSRSGARGCLLGAGIGGVLLLAILAVVAAVLLTAWTGSDEAGPAAPSATPSPTPTPDPWCELLTPDEAADVVGPADTAAASRPEPGADTGLLREADTTCSLRLLDGGTGWLALDPAAGDLGFAAAQVAARSAGLFDGEAAGEGDDAFCLRRESTGAVGAVVRSGEAVVLAVLLPPPGLADEDCGDAGELALAVLGGPVPRPSPAPSATPTGTPPATA